MSLIQYFEGVTQATHTGHHEAWEVRAGTHSWVRRSNSRKVQSMNPWQGKKCIVDGWVSVPMIAMIFVKREWSRVRKKRQEPTG